MTTASQHVVAASQGAVATRAARSRPAEAQAPVASEPLLPVVGGELAVTLQDGGTARYANLDYAASAPALESVARLVQDALPYYASVHRGAGYPSQVSTALYEGCRGVVADFVQARDDDLVVFTRNTTDSLNAMAGCLPPGGRVVLLDIEHHANFLPWQRCRHTVVHASTTLSQTLADLERAVAEQPTALVTITGASNVTGEDVPLDDVVAMAHAHGARVLVDAAQLAPHRRISLRRSGIDYVAFSGHKLYAPYGAGVLVGRRDWLDSGRPHLDGGGAVRAVGLDGVVWTTGPQRHEAGSPNVLGAAAVAASCAALAALPAAALEAHEQALRTRLTAALRETAGVSIHRIWTDSPSSIGVVTFSVEGYDAALVAAVLSAEHGVGVRDGRFCAHPLLSSLGLSGGAVRASVGVGSRLEDVDRLVAGVRMLLASGPGSRYVARDGRWEPESGAVRMPDVLAALVGGGPVSGPASPCQTS